MELLRLKKRTKLAQKGHKLLKEKRDGLMQEFLKIIREARVLRREVDQGLRAALKHFGLAQAVMEPQATRMVSHFRVMKPSLTVKERNVMGVILPDFTIDLKTTNEHYGVWETSGELDLGMDSFKKIMPSMLKLAAIEKSAELLAQEIEKTRRRVNALEYVLIPQLKRTTKYIRMKLDEQERAQIIATMAVKKAIEA